MINMEHKAIESFLFFKSKSRKPLGFFNPAFGKTAPPASTRVIADEPVLEPIELTSSSSPTSTSELSSTITEYSSLDTIFSKGGATKKQKKTIPKQKSKR